MEGFVRFIPSLNIFSLHHAANELLPLVVWSDVHHQRAHSERQMRWQELLPASSSSSHSEVLFSHFTKGGDKALLLLFVLLC